MNCRWIGLATCLFLWAAASAALGQAPPPAAPHDGAKAWIANPFYPRPVWKLWFETAAPVPYAGRTLGDPRVEQREFAPPQPEKRMYPDLLAPAAYPAPFLQLTARPGAAAGFWDDAFATLDGAHSLIPQQWSGGAVSANLAGQFIRVDFGAPDFLARMRLGINFTSQSLSEHGHQLVDHPPLFDRTEREFFFANTVRGTPAYLSYRDVLPEKTIDSYDALFAQSFQSLGRSGSETGALLKMLIAGAYLPRTTKDLLKRHGAYAPALLTIFRAALPYADEHGEVPWANELRHRVAYQSNGQRGTQEFAPLNLYYHAYDEPLHLWRMIELARGMQTAPPVAILDLVGFQVEKEGRVISKPPDDPMRLEPESDQDSRVKGNHKTMLRIWGQPGETITARIDLRGSYDLQGLPLRYEAQRVYPEQRNVAIRPEKEAGVFSLVARHDPKLPKGRIPVILWADNGKQPSAPVFVNFYWPDAGQAEQPGYFTPPPKGAAKDACNEVTRNLRPSIASGLPGNVLWCEPGKPARFTVESRDPEGFPVRLYRWSSDRGTLAGKTCQFIAEPGDAGRVFPLHLIASDGTGGYNSLLVRAVVGKPDTQLPAGWTGAVVGSPRFAGWARLADGRLELAGQGRGIADQDEGHAAWLSAEGPIDLVAEPIGLAHEGTPNPLQVKTGLIVREDEGPNPRELFVGLQGSSKAGSPWAGIAVMRTQPGGFVTSTRGDKTLATPPASLRIIRRGGWLAGYQSADGRQWEQIAAAPMEMPKRALAGLFVAADVPSGERRILARVTFRVPTTPAQSLPLVQVQGKASRPGTAELQAPVEITLQPPPGDCRTVYTLDSAEPADQSARYDKPLRLSEPGRHVVKARAFYGHDGGPTVYCVIVIAGKPG